MLGVLQATAPQRGLRDAVAVPEVLPVAVAECGGPLLADLLQPVRGGDLRDDGQSPRPSAPP